jgi:hypothetical protein
VRPTTGCASASESRTSVRLDHFNQANNGVIKGLEFLGWNPVFGVIAACRFLFWILGKMIGSHAKASNVPDSARLHVPSARYLHGILFLDHRIENRLVRQARWKAAKPTRLNECKFLRSDWAIKDHKFAGHPSANTTAIARGRRTLY